MIWTLEKLGLARNVVRIAPERQLERERKAAPRRAAASAPAAEREAA